MRKVIKTRKDTNDQLAETREGLLETYEATDMNASDITDLRGAVIELYEIVVGGAE